MSDVSDPFHMAFLSRVQGGEVSGGGVCTKFRKKPVEIEARLVTASSMDDVARWCGSYVRHFQLASTGAIPQQWKESVIPIQTLEGEMIARLGDWIVQGVKGEFYPCKPDIFEATYERVSA